MCTYHIYEMITEGWRQGFCMERELPGWTIEVASDRFTFTVYSLLPFELCTVCVY